MNISEISRQYANCGNTIFEEHVLPFRPMSELLEYTKEILVACKGEDTLAINARADVLSLRRRLVFALSDFNSAAVGLDGLMEACAQSLRNIPGASRHISGIVALIGDLKLQKNPKQEFVTNLIRSGGSGALALMLKMSFRDIVQWDDYKNVPGGNIHLINSYESLKETCCDTLIIPGSIHLMSELIRLEGLMTGRSAKVVFVRYDSEWIRLEPPKSLPWTVTRPSVNSFGTKVIKAANDVKPAFDKTCSSFEDECEHHEDANGETCIVLLFENGELVYTPIDRKYLILSDARLASTTELLLLDAASITEGDVMAIRMDHRRNILAEDEDDMKKYERVDVVCDWKTGLDSLRITYTDQQISESMLRMGAKGKNLSNSVRQWSSEGTTYGPGKYEDFSALIKILHDQRKLDVKGDLQAYIDSHWRDLEHMRHDFMRQGVDQRIQMMDELRSKYGSAKDIYSSDSFISANGIAMKLARVAAIDGRARKISRRFVLVPRMRA